MQVAVLTFGRIRTLYLPLKRRETLGFKRKRNILANLNFLPYEGRA
jgi:hypothetical protein